MKDVLVFAGLSVWFLFLCGMWLKWFCGDIDSDTEEGAIVGMTIAWWIMVFII